MLDIFLNYPAQSILLMLGGTCIYPIIEIIYLALNPPPHEPSHRHMLPPPSGGVS